MRRSLVAEGLPVTRTEQLGKTSLFNNFRSKPWHLNLKGSSSYPSRMNKTPFPSLPLSLTVVAACFHEGKDQQCSQSAAPPFPST